jgi:regulatory protein
LSSREGRSAYLDALYMLSRRELSEQQLRDRLLEREHDPEEIAAALGQLREQGSLDDGRVARAYARTAVKIKGRGRLRIQRELQQLGISKDVAAEALAETFGEVDERSLITQAIQKKLRGKRKLESPAEYARLYQFLMRQGFSPGGVSAALRTLRRSSGVSDAGDDV